MCRRICSCLMEFFGESDRATRARDHQTERHILDSGRNGAGNFPEKLDSQVQEMMWQRLPLNSGSSMGIELSATRSGSSASRPRLQKTEYASAANHELTEKDLESLLELPPQKITHVTSGSAVSSAQYAEPCQTLLFLDFDDTIFPTSGFFEHWNVDRRSPNEWPVINYSAEQRRLLGQWRSAAYQFLQTARALSDRVVIVTNATHPWVAKCIEGFAPDLREHLSLEEGGLLAESEGGIPVVYARSNPHMKEYMNGPGPLTYRSALKKMTREEMNSYLTAVKSRAMCDEARRFYKQYPNQSWKNILSIGDSSYEHDAVQEVAFRRVPSQRGIVRTKAVVLLQKPSVSELITGLTCLRHLLPAFVNWDGDLDVDTSVLQHRGPSESNELLSEFLGSKNMSNEELQNRVEAALENRDGPTSRNNLLNFVWSKSLNSKAALALPKHVHRPFVCASVSFQEDTDCEESIQHLISALDGVPSFLLVHAPSDGSLAKVVSSLKNSACSASTVFGCTSFLGTLTGGRLITAGGSLFGIRDPTGCYVSCARSVDDSACYEGWRKAAMSIATEALSASGLSSLDGFQTPLVLLHATPGFEEAVLEGITSVLPRATICGGSAAHCEFDPLYWSVAAGQGSFFPRSQVLPARAIALALLWPSRPYVFSLNCVHQPAARMGQHTIVTETRANGRQILTLGGEAAFNVYSKWCEEEEAAQHSNVSSPPDGATAQVRGLDSRTTLNPLARVVVSEDSETHYFPLHAHTTEYADGALGLFASARDGDELVLLSGTQESLIHGMRKAIEQSREEILSGPFGGQIAGAFVICCAGLAAEMNRAGNLHSLAKELNTAFQSKNHDCPPPPLHGFFAYGEQGPLMAGESCHANLMFNLLVFYRE